jgi:hypothetical protein
VPWPWPGRSARRALASSASASLAARLGEVRELSVDAPHGGLSLILALGRAQQELRGDPMRPLPGGAATVPHTGSGRTTGGLDPAPARCDPPHRLGQQPRVRRVGHIRRDNRGVCPQPCIAQQLGLRRIGQFPLTSVMRRTSVASEADMKPGNRKGTNPGPPDRTRRTRRTAIVLRTPPPVLNGTAANCGPPFGTKRPQVQILSPRPVFPQARGPHRNW